MSDTLTSGRRFRTFNIVDDFNREALHIEIDTSITSARPVRVFERLRAQHSLPQVRRTDHGPKFLGEAFTGWAKVNWHGNPVYPTRKAEPERLCGTV